MSKPIIFVSSTCYDLIDTRAEIYDYLKQHGFEVRLSDIAESDFEVNPQANSIESCLQNVETSDALVLILDKRYGPPLPNGKYTGKSATHAEVLSGLSHKKKLFYFIRDRAFIDYQQLKYNEDHNATWIEPGKPERQKLYKSFVESLFALPQHSYQTNWFDQFKTSADLKYILHKRLLDAFPGQRVIEGASPERFVPLVMNNKVGVSGTWGQSDMSLQGSFFNVGHAPAFSIRTTLPENPSWPGQKWNAISAGEEVPFIFRFPGRKREQITPTLYYKNKFEDNYKMERRITFDDSNHEIGEHVYFILLHTHSGNEWIEISRI